MGLLSIFSKRQKKLRGEMPDVYRYDDLPGPLRVQIIHIWHDTLGNSEQYHRSYNGVGVAYQSIVEALRREYGVFVLPPRKPHNNETYLEELANFLLNEREIEKVLDAVELSFRVIINATGRYEYLLRADAGQRVDQAIEELNARFREHGVGYQFADGDVIRVDSTLIHEDVVKPTLAVLRSRAYAGAQAEFLRAHEHYRHSRPKEALTESLKALESVMKSICAKRGWRHDANATSSALIEVLFRNGLIPLFWTQHFSALRSSLESGVPTARNRLGGHGQGQDVVDVPNHIVAYVLHLTAAAILFLTEAEGS